MALSPQDIVNHEFKQALRGYAVQEVDDLLDRLADQLERAERDIADLQQRLVDADARTSEALATESSLKRTLITAQDAAQRTIDDAQIHADTVRADADRQAEARLDEAMTRSTAMLEEAEAETISIRSAGRSEQQALATRVAELAALEDRYRMQLRSLLEHEMRGLERLEATGAPGAAEVEQVRDALPAVAIDGLGEGTSDAASRDAQGRDGDNGHGDNGHGDNGHGGDDQIGDDHGGDDHGGDDHVDPDRDPMA